MDASFVRPEDYDFACSTLAKELTGAASSGFGAFANGSLVVPPALAALIANSSNIGA